MRRYRSAGNPQVRPFVCKTGGSLQCKRSTPQSLQEIEQSEAEGRITVTTLNRVAEALGAEVRIAVIPNRSLSEMLRNQARKVAMKIVTQTQTHMSLEDQSNSEEFLKQQVEKLTDELVRKADRRIWDEK